MATHCCQETGQVEPCAKAALLSVRNLVAQNKVPEEVREWVDDVVQCLEEVESAIREGEKL